MATLQVFLAHTGQCFETDPTLFTSLDAFKAWVAKNSNIIIQHQIPLNGDGKQVRFAGLAIEKEVFIYDRRIISASSPGSAKSVKADIPIPSSYLISNPPDTIAGQNDLQAWKDLFTARRKWALSVLSDCSGMVAEAQKRQSEMQVIIRGASAAVQNIQRHVFVLDQKHASHQTWVQEIEQAHRSAHTDWEVSLQRLRSLPTTNEIVKFITGHDPRKGQLKTTLESIVNTENVKKAGILIQGILQQLSRSSKELGDRVDEIFLKSDKLVDRVSEDMPKKVQGLTTTQSLQLMQDIEALANKISSDCENVLDDRNPRTISQASKSALLHTKSFLPNLSKRSMEMDSNLRSATKIRNDLAAESLELMKQIAFLTALVTDTNARLATLERSEEAEDALHLLTTIRLLPVTYASFLAEGIRRKEWKEKIKADVSTLANEMASFQGEESKRRRKWQKAIGSTLWGEKPDPRAIGLEVQIVGQDDDWPMMSRHDLEHLSELFNAQDSNSSLAIDISRIIADFNNPTKQQSKRARAFKSGSIHEAAIGRSALLIRGDDDLIREIQAENQKTDMKLKTAESRVRKLEGLLHRQTQMSRIPSGNMFQLLGDPNLQGSPSTQNPLQSPYPNDDLSRLSSMSSRRFSVNHSSDDKLFQQKLVLLEAELVAERERASGLEKEATTRKTAESAMKTQIEEANSTKKDLLGNFEARQREFTEERKSLNEEIKRLKAQKEDLEEELDRYVGFRENERSIVDDRVRVLQDELDRARKETRAEAQKSEGQVDHFWNDAVLHRESNENLKRQLHMLEQDNKQLLSRAEKAESTVYDQFDVIHRVYNQLLPSNSVPNDLSTLANTLIEVSGKLVTEHTSVTNDVVLARSEQKAAQNYLADCKSEMNQIKEKLSAEASQTLQLRDTLAEERGRFAALEAQLRDERQQLSALKTKIADGESGSDYLRTRLEEEERKATNISEALASYSARIRGLEQELRSYQDLDHTHQDMHEKLILRLEGRTSRAKDLTQRLYMQNDRLCMLLDRLSYSVTREGNSMTITRLPRPERPNHANDSSDPASTVRRSISGVLGQKKMIDSHDLELLDWMYNEELETEAEKYDSYLNTIGNFDIESFCEVMIRRVKDIEYTAKKWSRDARVYREKWYMAQKEAHEKIAFKSFKEGDLALFLPTRNQSTGVWAAFNVGAPHYFLREQDSHKLGSRDWLLARIHKIEDRVVDLSKSMSHLHASDRASFGEVSNGGDSLEDENPFDLSDGLRWHLIDAAEEKPGAPTTPGLGKSTVASANIDATGSIRRSKKFSSSGMQGINKTLSKSLDSRRGSNNSKKSIPTPSTLIKTSSIATDTASLKAAATTQTAVNASETQMIINPSKPDDTVVTTNEGGETANVENIRSSEISKSAGSASKSMIWTSLCSIDLSLESGKMPGKKCD